MTKLAADEDDMVEDVEALGQAFLSTVTVRAPLRRFPFGTTCCQHARADTQTCEQAKRVDQAGAGTGGHASGRAAPTAAGGAACVAVWL